MSTYVVVHMLHLVAACLIVAYGYERMKHHLETPSPHRTVAFAMSVVLIILGVMAGINTIDLILQEAS